MQPNPRSSASGAARAGLVTLNRPKALNALTHGMVRELRAALDAWAADPAVTRIVVQGAGDRAFCAGGDIRRALRRGQGRAATTRRSPSGARSTALNIRIKRYPKPYVALIDGIVMGGGVGVSLHGSHRVAGDRYRFAMPEVGIGFFPDVGATYALPRLPGAAGTYLALTGARVGPDDAGRARARDACRALGRLRRRCSSGCSTAGDAVDAALAAARGRPAADGPITRRARPDRSLLRGRRASPAILGRLDAAARDGSDFAAETAATIRDKAPVQPRDRPRADAARAAT